MPGREAPHYKKKAGSQRPYDCADGIGERKRKNEHSLHYERDRGRVHSID